MPNTEFPIDEAKLKDIKLDHGGHDAPKSGLCLMEAVAFVRGIQHTDHPPCVSSFLGAAGRYLNDGLSDLSRQGLIPFIPDLPGTAGDGLDDRRGFMVLDWLARTVVPMLLDHVPSCQEMAAAIRALAPVIDQASAGETFLVLRDVRWAVNNARSEAQFDNEAERYADIAGSMISMAWAHCEVVASSGNPDTDRVLRTAVSMISMVFAEPRMSVERSAVELYGRLARLR